MDKATVDRLYGILLDRAGLRGKTSWTAAEAARFNAELDKMPGEFRERIYQNSMNRDPDNMRLARKYNMPVELMMKLVYAGNESYMRNRGHSESALAGPLPGIPGNTFGVEIPRSVITPT